MSLVENPGGREHIGEKFVTYNMHRESRGPRSDYPPFSHCSEEEEEEEAQREPERRAERGAERRMGDIYERPEGSGKAPMDLEATFMQVLNNLMIRQ